MMETDLCHLLHLDTDTITRLQRQHIQVEWFHHWLLIAVRVVLLIAIKIQRQILSLDSV